MRTLTYAAAISEGLVQAMSQGPSIFVTGISVDYSSAVFGTVKEARERFPERVFSSPAMENALTGIAIGAASQGMQPVIVHDRADFSFLAFDQLINLAAKWRYMYGGNAGSVPIVVRMIIGRGWGQGATHSQSIQSMLAHWPGLRVLMPWDAFSAYNALLWSLSPANRSPTIILEHRSLYEKEGLMWEYGPREPDYMYQEIGPSDTNGITLVATSSAVVDAIDAATTLLNDHQISSTVITIESIQPLKTDAILSAVNFNGRLLVCDTSHELCGFASEICALVTEKAFTSLKAAPRRLTLPDCPAPVARSLEQAFYPRASTIAALVLDMLGKEVPSGIEGIDRVDAFKGPY